MKKTGTDPRKTPSVPPAARPAPSAAPRRVPAQRPAPRPAAPPRRRFDARVVGVSALALVLLALAALAVVLLSGPRVRRELKLEAGSPFPAAIRFVDDPKLSAEYVSDTSGIDTATPGVYAVTVRVDGKDYAVTLRVVDTTPPTGQTADRTVWLGETLDPEAFVGATEDATAVDVAFKAKPVFERVGTQAVALLLTDAAGNQTELSAKLTVKKDATAPTISGVKDLDVFLGESVAYREGVTVTDDRDATVALQIDNTGVDLTQPGTYTVVYSATDAAGNRAEVPATVTVREKPEGYVSEAELNALVDGIFVEILKPGMSDLQRMSEIFYYIAGHIRYTDASDEGDWVKAAYLGITRATGDCYNYFALAKAMLTRAGYETIPITRAPAKTHHYWNLVKYNGEWYHFDALPNLKYYHYVCLLRTDAEVAEFSKQKDAEGLFYVFDHAGIPATATTPLDIERKVVYG